MIRGLYWERSTTKEGLWQAVTPLGTYYIQLAEWAPIGPLQWTVYKDKEANVLTTLVGPGLVTAAMVLVEAYFYLEDSRHYRVKERLEAAQTSVSDNRKWSPV